MKIDQNMPSRVLVISAIFPISELSHKKNENDIVLETQNKIGFYYNGITFRNIYPLIYSNDFLGLFSKKWKELSTLRKYNYFRSKDDVKIDILPIIQLPYKVEKRGLLFKLSLLKYKRRLDNIIQEFKPTVIHAQDADVSAYIARYIKEKYDIPYIVTLRGINFIHDHLIHQNLLGARALLSVSKTQKNDGLKYFDLDSITIPHGIDAKFFQSHKENVSNNLRLIFVGRLLKLKNINIIISAIKDLDNVHFDIIGDGPEENNIRDQIGNLKLNHRIKLLGRLNHEEIIRLLPSYDIFAMVSYPETLGRVYFEAMASGLPVLACKNTGIDGLIVDSVQGFLVDKDGQLQIEEILEHISKNRDLLNKMKIEAINFAENYKWDNIAELYKNIYNL
ncbi:glycosyltransferase [Sphingobacterium sp. WOUb80]|uniref:glycosyltransferase n=1 Tax=Sphingobacterium sp. WOUb80 TaxID=3234028 RepID=UPI003CEC234C